MVCEWGMSEKIGPVAIGKKEENVFLGKDFHHQGSAFSQKTAEMVDSEIQRIVTENYNKAKSILESKIAILHRMAEVLLERETIGREEIELLMAGQPLPAFVPNSSKIETFKADTVVVDKPKTEVA
jgi:cell division protease FtsH